MRADWFPGRQPIGNHGFATTGSRSPQTGCCTEFPVHPQDGPWVRRN